MKLLKPLPPHFTFLKLGQHLFIIWGSLEELLKPQLLPEQQTLPRFPQCLHRPLGSPNGFLFELLR
jgi:hypothetical protein